MNYFDDVKHSNEKWNKNAVCTFQIQFLFELKVLLILTRFPYRSERIERVAASEFGSYAYIVHYNLVHWIVAFWLSKKILPIQLAALASIASAIC